MKQIKLELERRGNVVQTLLANIAAGVVSVDPSGKITTWNKAAEQILEVAAERALGKHYQEVFRAEPLLGLREIVDSVKGGESIEREIKLSLHEQLRNVVVSAATLHDDDGSILGTMLFLEDITQIQKVQRMEAWREVADHPEYISSDGFHPSTLGYQRLATMFYTSAAASLGLPA